MRSVSKAALLFAICTVGSACAKSNADSIPQDGARATAGVHTTRHPTLYIIGVDVSDSFQTPERVDQARRLVDDVIQDMTYGDAIAIVETFRSGSDSVGSWTDSIPPTRHPGSPSINERHQLDNFKDVAKAEAASFVHPRKPATSTDILALVQRASDYANVAELHGRRTTLIVVSDMLNYSNELKMTDIASIPTEGWVTARKAQGLIPELPATCIGVSGADVSSARGIAVRNFWQNYFNATGANFSQDRYRTLILDAKQVSCR